MYRTHSRFSSVLTGINLCTIVVESSVMLSATKHLGSMSEILRRVYPERSEWAQDDKRRDEYYRQL